MAFSSKVRRLFQAKRKMLYSWSAKYLSGHESGSTTLGTLVMSNSSNKPAKVELQAKMQVGLFFSVPSTSDVLFAKWNAYFNFTFGAIEGETYVQTTGVSAVSTATTVRGCGLSSALERPLMFTIPPQSTITISISCVHITPAVYVHSGAVSVVALTSGNWYDTSNIMMMIHGIADEGVTIDSALPFAA